MPIVFWILGGLVVFAIAAVALGRVTAGLAASPVRRVFDADQALEFVAEALPAELTAELSYDDVRRIQRLFHDHLHAHGVATTAGEDAEAPEVAIIDPDEAVADVVARAAHADIVVDPAHARAVIEAQMAYFEAIGAVEPAADEPPELGSDPTA